MRKVSASPLWKIDILVEFGAFLEYVFNHGG